MFDPESGSDGTLNIGDKPYRDISVSTDWDENSRLRSNRDDGAAERVPAIETRVGQHHVAAIQQRHRGINTLDPSRLLSAFALRIVDRYSTVDRTYRLRDRYSPPADRGSTTEADGTEAPDRQPTQVEQMSFLPDAPLESFGLEPDDAPPSWVEDATTDRTGLPGRTRVRECASESVDETPRRQHATGAAAPETTTAVQGTKEGRGHQTTGRRSSTALEQLDRIDSTTGNKTGNEAERTGTGNETRRTAVGTLAERARTGNERAVTQANDRVGTAERISGVGSGPESRHRSTHSDSAVPTTPVAIGDVPASTTDTDGPSLSRKGTATHNDRSPIERAVGYRSRTRPTDTAAMTGWSVGTDIRRLRSARPATPQPGKSHELTRTAFRSQDDRPATNERPPGREQRVIAATHIDQQVEVTVSRPPIRESSGVPSGSVRGSGATGPTRRHDPDRNERSSITDGTGQPGTGDRSVIERGDGKTRTDRQSRVARRAESTVSETKSHRRWTTSRAVTTVDGASSGRSSDDTSELSPATGKFVRSDGIVLSASAVILRRRTPRMAVSESILESVKAENRSASPESVPSVDGKSIPAISAASSQPRRPRTDRHLPAVPAGSDAGRETARHPNGSDGPSFSSDRTETATDHNPGLHTGAGNHVPSIQPASARRRCLTHLTPRAATGMRLVRRGERIDTPTRIGTELQVPVTSTGSTRSVDVRDVDTTTRETPTTGTLETATDPSPGPNWSLDGRARTRSSESRESTTRSPTVGSGPVSPTVTATEQQESWTSPHRVTNRETAAGDARSDAAGRTPTAGPVTADVEFGLARSPVPSQFGDEPATGNVRADPAVSRPAEQPPDRPGKSRHAGSSTPVRRWSQTTDRGRRLSRSEQSSTSPRTANPVSRATSTAFLTDSLTVGTRISMPSVSRRVGDRIVSIPTAIARGHIGSSATTRSRAAPVPSDVTVPRADPGDALENSAALRKDEFGNTSTVETTDYPPGADRTNVRRGLRGIDTTSNSKREGVAAGSGTDGTATAFTAETPDHASTGWTRRVPTADNRRSNNTEYRSVGSPLAGQSRFSTPDGSVTPTQGYPRSKPGQRNRERPGVPSVLDGTAPARTSSVGGSSPPRPRFATGDDASTVTEAASGGPSPNRRVEPGGMDQFNPAVDVWNDASNRDETADSVAKGRDPHRTSLATGYTPTTAGEYRSGVRRVAPAVVNAETDDDRYRPVGRRTDVQSRSPPSVAGPQRTQEPHGPESTPRNRNGANGASSTPRRRIAARVSPSRPHLATGSSSPVDGANGTGTDTTSGSVETVRGRNRERDHSAATRSTSTATGDFESGIRVLGTQPLRREVSSEPVSDGPDRQQSTDETRLAHRATGGMSELAQSDPDQRQHRVPLRRQSVDTEGGPSPGDSEHPDTSSVLGSSPSLAAPNPIRSTDGVDPSESDTENKINKYKSDQSKRDIDESMVETDNSSTGRPALVYRSPQPIGVTSASGRQSGTNDARQPTAHTTETLTDERGADSTTQSWTDSRSADSSSATWVGPDSERGGRRRRERGARAENTRRRDEAARSGNRRRHQAGTSRSSVGDGRDPKPRQSGSRQDGRSGLPERTGSSLPETATSADRFDGARSRHHSHVDSPSRPSTQQSRGDRGSQSGRTESDVPLSGESLRYEADVDRVVERLYRKLERRKRIERERRGKR